MFKAAGQNCFYRRSFYLVSGLLWNSCITDAGSSMHLAPFKIIISTYYEKVAVFILLSYFNSSHELIQLIFLVIIVNCCLPICWLAFITVVVIINKFCLIIFIIAIYKDSINRKGSFNSIQQKKTYSILIYTYIVVVTKQWVSFLFSQCFLKKIVKHFLCFYTLMKVWENSQKYSIPVLLPLENTEETHTFVTAIKR